MKYEIIISSEFDRWLKSLSDNYINRMLSRLYQLENGNFGDYKRINELVYELRFFFGKGYRVYYTIEQNEIIILLCGGDKSKQSKDIKRANEILKKREIL